MADSLRETLKAITEIIDQLARIDQLRDLLSPDESEALETAKRDLVKVLTNVVERVPDYPKKKAG
jgi:hypothetical protein